MAQQEPQLRSPSPQPLHHIGSYCLFNGTDVQIFRSLLKAVEIYCLSISGKIKYMSRCTSLFRYLSHVLGRQNSTDLSFIRVHHHFDVNYVVVCPELLKCSFCNFCFTSSNHFCVLNLLPCFSANYYFSLVMFLYSEYTSSRETRNEFILSRLHK